MQFQEWLSRFRESETKKDTSIYSKAKPLHEYKRRVFKVIKPSIEIPDQATKSI